MNAKQPKKESAQKDRFKRPSGRDFDELRSVVFKPDYLDFAEGSAYVEMGKTRVVATASVEDKVPPFLKGSGSGWVTAEYSMRPDGKIRVLNSGYKGDLNGKFKTAEGKARQPDPKEPGKLEVAFFLWFYGDYNILELDERNYAYVLIGSSSDKYLWILSRTPQLPEETIKMLLDKATERGYDTSKLIWVKQK